MVGRAQLCEDISRMPVKSPFRGVVLLFGRRKSLWLCDALIPYKGTKNGNPGYYMCNPGPRRGPVSGEAVYAEILICQRHSLDNEGS